ncbi:MAG: protein kinase [Gemmatimonadetes bacterium]|nr:protein kinase [Gemmatimonadota bacterium]
MSESTPTSATGGDADGERWRQLQALFDAAADLDPEARPEFLASIEDAALREQVLSLLEALDREGGELEVPAVERVDPSTATTLSENLAGSRIGSYRLLRLVGSGGMGVVYEAQRADEQYRQRVAIKLLRQGVDSRLTNERFRRERQILAALDHPGIARLLDGGATEDGRPYYVMEFIDGVPITEYCARARLGLRDRLRLFREVCAAVHFAHKNMVVHRDLKPGNVLVAGDGRVKLLDFGIAKLLSAGGRSEQTLTLYGGRMLTPAYASPEQVQGEPVTTASDVYSLGVLLYELLTGRKPFASDTASTEDLMADVLATEPTRPSDAVSEETIPQLGRADWRAIRRRLEGELDNIVLMALRKEPNQRYPSVSQLSDDVRRYLDRLPVLAQGDAAGYRARKFVARHRVGALAVGLVLVLLVGGFSATLVQARRAERARDLAEARFDDTRTLANALLFELHDVVADLPGSTLAREMLVSKGLEYLDALAAETDDDPALQAELAEAYFRLGMVLGTPSGASLGQVSQAEVSFGRSLDIAQRLVDQGHTEGGAHRSLALAHEKLGDVLAFRGALDEGIDHARRALGLWSLFAQSSPEDERARLSAVISHVKLGDLLGNPTFVNAGDEAGAIGEYQYALNLLSSAPLAESDDAGVLRYRGLVHERLGGMMRGQERFEEALVSLERSLATRIELAADEGTELLRDVAVTYHQICGTHLSLGDLPSASQNCSAMLGLYQRLFDRDPANAQAGRDLALGHEMVARLHRAAGRVQVAGASLREAIAVRDALRTRAPDDLVNRRDRARALIRLCELVDDSAACRLGLDELEALMESGVTTEQDEELKSVASARL